MLTVPSPSTSVAVAPDKNAAMATSVFAVPLASVATTLIILAGAVITGAVLTDLLSSSGKSSKVRPVVEVSAL